ncbi:6662_t:CDS:10 [Ambispora leptoticha]|uniref:6662_t:CDS:1 n=1 Tax=Ambispora leptoticha TaxID=144679 RepID=A0A9N9AW72_9GLOM|nr:6662_t:CDS:10 [Ambispora leptoticha]
MTSNYCRKGHVEVARQNEKNPIKIYYEIHGNGPKKLLFIMGLSTSCVSWSHQVKYFGSHKDYQICVFDNRGIGWSGNDIFNVPPGFYSTSQMADDTFDLLDHLSWTSKVHLVGVSMGGMIAQEMAYARPEYFQSLCLTSTHAGGCVPPLTGVLTIMRSMFIRDRHKKIPIMIKLLFPPSWLDSPAPSGSSFETNKAHLMEELRRQIQLTNPTTLTGSVGQIAAVLSHGVSRERLIQIRENIPRILVITGTWDNLVNPKNSYYLGEELQADLQIFEGSGHALPTEQAERYNMALEDHFRKAEMISLNRPVVIL